MIELSREQLKADKIYNMLFEHVKKTHKVAKHTEKTLIEHQHIKEWCEEAGHYQVLFAESPDPMYIRYVTHSWFKKPMGVQVSIRSITVFDDFLEYNTERLKNLHGAKSKDMPDEMLN